MKAMNIEASPERESTATIDGDGSNESAAFRRVHSWNIEPGEPYARDDRTIVILTFEGRVVYSESQEGSVQISQAHTSCKEKTP